MNVSFEKPQAEDCNRVLPILFEILYENMTAIAPTGYTYEEDWLAWSEYNTPRIESGEASVLLMMVEEEIVGYFQYSIEENCLWAEEVEIKPEYQLTKLFYLFCHYLVSWMLPDVQHIKSYVRKDNRRSILLHEHLGMERIGENRKGTSWLYCGDTVNMASCLRK